MAEFCSQCSQELGHPHGDFAGLCGPDEYVLVVCEGCLEIQCDSDGNCVSPDCLKKHGSQQVA